MPITDEKMAVNGKEYGNKIEAEINDYNRLKEIGIKMPALIDVDIKNGDWYRTYGICY